jgi:hypothetical protein
MAAPTENPFPGMNPYLEQWWGNARTALVVYTADWLQEHVPDDLRARMDERVFIETANPSLAISSPVELTEPYIEIRDVRAGGRLVTVIDYVSPFNKGTGIGQDVYLAARRERQGAGVNTVEIDLLRGGLSVMRDELRRISPEEVVNAPYHVYVTRASDSYRVDVYVSPLRKHLPRIPIPLRPADDDVILDLQEMLNLCYRRGRYDDIDYTKPLTPPLDADDAAWAVAVLKRAGLR